MTAPAPLRRTFVAYGLPWRGAFGRQFWAGWGWGLGGVAALAALIAALGGLRVAGWALSGAALARAAVLWAIAMTLIGLAEEFAFRGYPQFTLASGVGFLAGGRAALAPVRRAALLPQADGKPGGLRERRADRSVSVPDVAAHRQPVVRGRFPRGVRLRRARDRRCAQHGQRGPAHQRPPARHDVHRAGLADGPAARDRGEPARLPRDRDAVRAVPPALSRRRRPAVTRRRAFSSRAAVPLGAPRSRHGVETHAHGRDARAGTDTGRAAARAGWAVRAGAPARSRRGGGRLPRPRAPPPPARRDQGAAAGAGAAADGARAVPPRSPHGRRPLPSPPRVDLPRGRGGRRRLLRHWLRRGGKPRAADPRSRTARPGRGGAPAPGRRTRAGARARPRRGAPRREARQHPAKIGRASCRERV